MIRSVRSILAVLGAALLPAQAPSPTAEQELAASLQFLHRHMPPADRSALDDAFLRGQIEMAHEARARVPWGRELSDELFLHYVLPYAQASEAREDWRRDLMRRFLPTVLDCSTPGEAALRLNATIFDALGVRYSTARQRADQAPSQSIAQGKASCTGLSILLADACRACCVPARLVSVRWPHRAGNHTWVEVFDGQAWRFLGAAEPDPAGLDRAWFVGDAARCEDADEDHRIWAVSFAATGARFRAGFGPGIELHGIDVTARYAAAAAQGGGGDEAVAAQLDRFFAADEKAQREFGFDRNLDAGLRTAAGDARLRALAFAAFRRAAHAELRADFAQQMVRVGDLVSPYTLRPVGAKPAAGWPLVVAMHGGGGVARHVNDAQWRHMQVYYRDQPEAGGYLYCALRAPTDEWNGFYTDSFYPLLERLLRQLVVCAEVDPDRVVAIGYSHGGYGAFALGPKLPHRFAAVHASAAAPTDGESLPTGLHTLAFSFMVGERDNAYGRRERCEAFDRALQELRAERTGSYPATFTLVAGHGHTGLPDRDLLQHLVPRVRQPVPSRLWFEASDTVVQDHYWLRLLAPERGQRMAARWHGQRLELALPDGAAVEVLLDARLCDLTQQVEVLVGERRHRLSPAPSLRTLCATLQQRGDPQLAASWVLRLP